MQWETPHARKKPKELQSKQASELAKLHLGFIWPEWESPTAHEDIRQGSR